VTDNSHVTFAIKGVSIALGTEAVRKEVEGHSAASFIANGNRRYFYRSL
jgi:hypothetical protein